MYFKLYLVNIIYNKFLSFNYYYIVFISVSCVYCMCMRKELSYKHIKVQRALYVWCRRLALCRYFIYIYSTLWSLANSTFPHLIFVLLETRVQGQQQQQYFFICSTTNIINRMKQAPRQAPQQQPQQRHQHRQAQLQRKHQMICKSRNHRHHLQHRHQV